MVASYPLDKTVPELAQDIRERVTPEVEGRDTDVVIEDIEVVEE